ncbi:MAG: MraY family glycosyltransferase [Bacteroidota bacterium]
MEYSETISIQDNIHIGLAACIAFIFSLYAIPVLVRLARVRKIYDQPNNRTAHLHPTPRLAGIAIFLSILISVSILASSTNLPNFQYISASCLVLFFTGIKDDFIGISFPKKFIAQIVAGSILIFLADIRFTSIHGFFGGQAISYPLSFQLTLFVIIGITNALNLLDGVDGLTGSISLSAFITLGAWFFVNNQSGYAIICAAAAGSLVAFLWFNIWSRKNKIFMGDTGSLFLGFLLSILVIRFNELNLITNIHWHISAAPVVSFGILIIPIFDTCRVMLSRILLGKSPFHPDKTHIHHYLLALGFSHKQVTSILFCTGIFYICLAFGIQHLNLYIATIILIGSALVLTYIPIFILQRKSHPLPWTVIREIAKKRAQ